MELWKDVVGYEGLYQVSNLGRVKSTGVTVIRGNGRPYTSPEKILRPRKRGKPRKQYHTVALYSNKKSSSIAIHRLVAVAFIPNPHNKPFVHHINNIPTDNRVSNLMWASACENMQAMVKADTGTFKKKRVVLMNLNDEELAIFKGVGDLSQILNCARLGIGACLSGKLKQYKGWKFKLAS